MYKFIKPIALPIMLLSHLSLGSLGSIDSVLKKSNFIDVNNVMAHLQELQKIADLNDGNRSSSSTGHELSANYIAQKLLAAGYDVKMVPYSYTSYKQIGQAQMEQVAPAMISYEEEKEFMIMPYSSSSRVSANVTGVDIQLGLGNESTSGCEVEDFSKFPAGNIALIQRGACSFAQKAINAQLAGASGVIIFNQGNEETRKEIFSGTLGNDSNLKITVASVAYELGEKLSQIKDLKISLTAQTKIGTDVSHNVIAETKSGNGDNVIMIGSHLDGVEAGPGINDNGSGSSGILEVAIKMADMKLNNKIRFAWWGSEELGLIGSTKYVEALSDSEKNKIALYLNFDMIASPNYMIGVFDGNASLTDYKAPKGSYAIESLFQTYFDLKGQNNIEIESSGRSDYAAFAEVNIPYGGLFTGAEGEMSKEEADLFGGVAGQAYDSCYHKECDDINNINLEALEINTNAIAFMALSFSYSTLSVEAEKNAPEAKSKRKMTRSYIPSDIGHDGHHLHDEVK